MERTVYNVFGNVDIEPLEEMHKIRHYSRWLCACICQRYGQFPEDYTLFRDLFVNGQDWIQKESQIWIYDRLVKIILYISLYLSLRYRLHAVS